jgi:hypothetical protein
MFNKKTMVRFHGKTLILIQKIQEETAFISESYTYKHTYKPFSLMLVGLLIVLILLLNHISITEAQSPTVKVNWVIHSNPTKYDEFAYSVCEAGDYIYIVGDQNDNARIEMRFKSNGSLVKAWSSEDFYILTDCIIVNGKLYVVSGNWDILVFDLNLNLLKFKLGRIDRLAKSINYFNNYLYIAGWEVVDGGGMWEIPQDRGWRVEKREIENLTSVKEYTINPTLVSWDLVFTAGINPVTEQVWVVGYERKGFRVEILDLDLNPLKVFGSDMWSEGYNIDFDEDGNAYICGWTFAAKYDKDGNEVVVRRMFYHNYKLKYVNGLIYVGAQELGSSDKHILFIYDKNLTQLNMITLGHYWFSKAGFIHGKVAFDGKNLYMIGYDKRPGDYEWTIYSISISPTEDSAISLIRWIVIIIATTATLSLVFLWFKRKHKSIRIKTKPRVPPPPI